MLESRMADDRKAFEGRKGAKYGMGGNIGDEVGS